MSRIYLDSMILAYWLEDHPSYAERVVTILERTHQRGDILCTSAFTLGEVLAGPYKQGAMEVADRITQALRMPFLEVIPFDAGTAQHFARIRATTSVSAPDAIHLASAAQTRVNLFLTNDKALHRLAIPGIDFIAGLDVNLF